MTHEDAGAPRRTAPVRWGLAALGAAGLLLAWLESFFVHDQVLLGILLIAVMSGAAALARLSTAGRWVRAAQVAAGIGIAAEIVWLISSWYPLWVIAQAAALLLALVAFVMVWVLRSRDRASGGRRLVRAALRGTGLFVTAITALVSTVVVTLSITTLPLAMALQSASGDVNSFAPEAPTRSKVVSGVLVTNDIRYGTKYPNSYLDVYIADNDATVSRPTYVIVHGGGFFAGSKTDGDPNAGGSYFALGGGPMLKAGYNLVTINYGLAPQVPYPTPVIQLSEAINFLKKHGSRYGLDMSRVVLSGGSAGGHIVGQYADIQTNPDYARHMKIAPSLGRDALKAVVLDSAALDPRRGNATQAPVAEKDWLFSLSMRAYFGTSERRLEEANVIDHVTSSFPPAFIADGNTGTFPDQARDLAKALAKRGVAHSLDLHPRSEAILGHGYMSSASRWTDDYNRRKLEFLTSVLK
ncbi:alpha/beta hydrolase [Streptomyces ipomoeae]|uniref:alpha/beta hydrolase n=1 Tax=Streptomyces ipomoeae TaxID=103232 RepID=UPI0011467E45|nr:alpha/beta hydrolase [Streptomyces ipomoeae]MDX2937799.1 alpha/beta hydrolase [Streptomyces ipomoeae]TQE27428.1 alpha/beta hydrolase [Streptomyces ipomoeae]